MRAIFALALVAFVTVLGEAAGKEDGRELASLIMLEQTTPLSPSDPEGVATLKDALRRAGFNPKGIKITQLLKKQSVMTFFETDFRAAFQMPDGRACTLNWKVNLFMGHSDSEKPQCGKRGKGNMSRRRKRKIRTRRLGRGKRKSRGRKKRKRKGKKGKKRKNRKIKKRKNRKFRKSDMNEITRGLNDGQFGSELFGGLMEKFDGSGIMQDLLGGVAERKHLKSTRKTKHLHVRRSSKRRRKHKHKGKRKGKKRGKRKKKHRKGKKKHRKGKGKKGVKTRGGKRGKKGKKKHKRGGGGKGGMAKEQTRQLGCQCPGQQNGKGMQGLTGGMGGPPIILPLGLTNCCVNGMNGQAGGGGGSEATRGKKKRKKGKKKRKGKRGKISRRRRKRSKRRKMKHKHKRRGKGGHPKGKKKHKRKGGGGKHSGGKRGHSKGRKKHKRKRGRGGGTKKGGGGGGGGGQIPGGGSVVPCGGAMGCGMGGGGGQIPGGGSVVPCSGAMGCGMGGGGGQIPAGGSVVPCDGGMGCGMVGKMEKHYRGKIQRQAESIVLPPQEFVGATFQTEEGNAIKQIEGLNLPTSSHWKANEEKEVMGTELKVGRLPFLL